MINFNMKLKSSTENTFICISIKASFEVATNETLIFNVSIFCIFFFSQTTESVNNNTCHNVDHDDSQNDIKRVIENKPTNSELIFSGFVLDACEIAADPCVGLEGPIKSEYHAIKCRYTVALVILLQPFIGDQRIDVIQNKVEHECQSQLGSGHVNRLDNVFQGGETDHNFGEVKSEEKRVHYRADHGQSPISDIINDFDFLKYKYYDCKQFNGSDYKPHDKVHIVAFEGHFFTPSLLYDNWSVFAEEKDNDENGTTGHDSSND